MKRVAQVLIDGMLPRPASIDGLATGLRATLASSVPDAVARPIEPVGTLVRDARPTFRWRPQYGASGYRVTLRDEQGAVLQISDTVPTTSWKSAEALTSGRTYAWTVEAVGKNVTNFKIGDEVFGTCNGSFAEYASTPQDTLVPKPANLTFEEASAVPTSGVRGT